DEVAPLNLVALVGLGRDRLDHAEAPDTRPERVADHRPDVAVIRALLELDLLPVERVDDDGVGRVTAAPDVRDRAADDVDQGVIRFRPRRRNHRVLDDTEEVLASAVTVEDLLLLVLAEV